MDNYEESVEFQELLKDYQQSRRQGRNTYFDSDAFIDIAEYYMTHNPMEEAFEVIEDGLAFHPNEEALLSLKANVLISMNRYDEAETILEHLDPEEDHDVYYFYGQLACGKERDYEKAKKLFKKWLKIEMSESLFYSWLRHVKECQIVQTNWTTSSQWQLNHDEQLEEIMSTTDRFFSEKYGYSIYKKTSSLSQLLQQAECDAIGIEVQGGTNKIYAVDVAFHEAGLNYGTRDATIKKIIANCLRTAMCIYGYLDAQEAEIIFASPKIHKSILDGVTPCLVDMQRRMDDLDFRFLFRIIANDDFRDKVLVPILKASNGVADTNELFIRSYQMTQMFEKKSVSPGKPTITY